MLTGGVFALPCSVHFFDTNNTLLVLGYSISYVELVATLLGITATILSALRITHTWLVNLVGVVFFSIVMYQLRLYADLILQAYYFFMGILGWLWWNKKAKHHQVPVRYLNTSVYKYILFFVCIGIAAVTMGYIVSNFHVLMPQWFPTKAAMPYANAVVLVLGVTGTFLMGKRYIENWWLWAVSNTLAIYIYWQTGSKLFAFVFVVYFVIGIAGWYAWQKEYKQVNKKI